MILQKQLLFVNSARS